MTNTLLQAISIRESYSGLAECPGRLLRRGRLRLSSLVRPPNSRIQGNRDSGRFSESPPLRTPSRPRLRPQPPSSGGDTIDAGIGRSLLCLEPLQPLFFLSFRTFPTDGTFGPNPGSSGPGLRENADDAKEIRAGRAAAGQFKVAAPLREAHLTKAEIRSLAREAGLDIAEKPASPCLSSRLAPGLPVTVERLAAIEKAEIAVRQYGFRIVRVRHLGDKALVQVSPEETARLKDSELQSKITPAIKAAGFAQIEFDPIGYQGSGLR